jgi:hypothetical protein
MTNQKDPFASSRAQLLPTLEALDYLRAQLSSATPVEYLRQVEDFACHLSNKVAGTPCHESCQICAEVSHD